MVCSTATVEVAVLYDACIWSLAVGEVHHSHTLVVTPLYALVLKTQSSVLQLAVAVVEVAVYLARIDNLLGNRLPMLSVIEEVAVQLDIRPLEKFGNKVIIATSRDALISIIEVVVIECKADRKATDNICREVSTISTPLLLGLAFDKSVIYICSNERNCLLLKVLRIFYTIALALYLCPCLLGCKRSPELAKGVHIEWQVIDFAIIVCQRRVDKRHKLDNRVHPLPHITV